MVRLHNCGKSLCGMPFQSQCASWFSQLHVKGSGEEPSQGVVSRLFGLGEDDIARASRMGWYVANVRIYTDNSFAFR